MQYVEPAEARHLPGLRLALTVGFPAPYSMSARAVLDLRGVPYVPVAQYAAQPNADLVAWTGHRNAPVAVSNTPKWNSLPASRVRAQCAIHACARARS